jgi:hypothetical protein
VIVEPLPGNNPAKITHSWKSYSANKANQLLHQTGMFWQHESYDHIIRTEKEYYYQMDYVWRNPEKAGIEAPRWKMTFKNHKPEQDAPITTWSLMAGSFDGWPQKAAELKCLDPCCGSGHFLVALFERLVSLRMAEEGLDAADAARAVLRDNIYGLEIDPRCTQLAAFNHALTAWKCGATASAAFERRLLRPGDRCL